MRKIRFVALLLALALLLCACGAAKTPLEQAAAYLKKAAPNPTAIIFALTNRDPENWKNRQTTDINANVKAENTNKPDLSGIPDDLLEQVLNKINGNE